MTIMTNPVAIIKIRLLQNSDASNYFETKERLFLRNILADLEKSNKFTLNENQSKVIHKIYEKYRKYL